MRFKQNQEVICVNDSGWSYIKWSVNFLGIKIDWHSKGTGPKMNEIVTVDGYEIDNTHIFLKEYNIKIDGLRSSYDEIAFEPVVPSETIEELMNSLQEQL